MYAAAAKCCFSWSRNDENDVRKRRINADIIYTYNDVHTITVAINVEVTMTMKENTMDRRRRG